MSTQTEQQTGRERSIIYIVAVVLLVVLVVIGLLSLRAARQSAEADEKAQELIQALEDAGVEVSLTSQQIASVLGDDGGAVCANPNDALSRSILLSQLANGAAGPGARPVIVEERLLQGQLLIIETYCPDELDEFQQFVDDLGTIDGGDS
ncbi:hypothetical protein [Agromyces sp. ZXT2-3]|uniref:hypothetical protein n=1 Tax=Agromyces sp. ZXT2-3 TaxID=3461152 RepID=UPI004054BF20